MREPSRSIAIAKRGGPNRFSYTSSFAYIPYITKIRISSVQRRINFSYRLLFCFQQLRVLAVNIEKFIAELNALLGVGLKQNAAFEQLWGSLDNTVSASSRAQTSFHACVVVRSGSSFLSSNVDTKPVATGGVPTVGFERFPRPVLRPFFAGGGLHIGHGKLLLTSQTGVTVLGAREAWRHAKQKA